MTTNTPDGQGSALPHACPEMASVIASGEVAITYNSMLREFGIPYTDGGTSIQLICHCPWCGAELPASLRDEWFAEIRALGLEWGDPGIPEKLMSDAWWQPE